MSRLFGPNYYTEADLAGEGFKSLGSNVRIAKNCTIIGAENIAIGSNVRIDGNCTLVAVGSAGHICLGSWIHLGGNSVILAGEGFAMEDFSTLSWGVKVFTRSDDFSGRHMTNPTVPEKYTGVKRGQVLIRRHTVVGAGCVILPGVTLQEGVALGALSMVNADLSAWGIYAGVPATRRKDRRRDIQTLEESLLRETAPQKAKAISS